MTMTIAVCVGVVVMSLSSLMAYPHDQVFADGTPQELLQELLQESQEDLDLLQGEELSLAAASVRAACDNECLMDVDEDAIVSGDIPACVMSLESACVANGGGELPRFRLEFRVPATQTCSRAAHGQFSFDALRSFRTERWCAEKVWRVSDYVSERIAAGGDWCACVGGDSVM